MGRQTQGAGQCGIYQTPVPRASQPEVLVKRGGRRRRDGWIAGVFLTRTDAAAVTCCFTSSPNSSLDCRHSSSDSDSKSRFSRQQPAHHRADHLVRLAERHAARHEVVGDVGGQQQARRGAAGAFRVQRQVADHRRRRVERHRERVFRVEQRLFVFLQILVVAGRQALHRDQESREVADRAARPCRARARADRGSSSAASCCCRSPTNRPARRTRIPRRSSG